MKEYIIEVSSGKIVFFGKTGKKPSLTPPDYERRSTPPAPSLEHLWINGEWVLPHSITIQKTLDTFLKTIDEKIKSTTEVVQCHMEQLELIARTVITETIMSDTKYQEYLVYRHNLALMMEAKQLTGTWTWTQGNQNVTSSDGDAVSQLTIGQYVKKDTDNVLYKVDSITDANTIVLTIPYQEAGGVGASSFFENIDTPTYPTKPA